MPEPNIILDDGSIITPDSELYHIAKMSAPEITKLADNLYTIATLFQNPTLKTAFLRKATKLWPSISGE